ncbi:MAG TPA: Flp family type IVb pilin [Terricaulis sp.]|nr:Flp family type IVb pilin [Terricaulis sp.]
MKRNFLKDERGATSIEYAVIAAMIFFAILTALGLIAPQLNNTFNNAEAGLTPTL